MSKNSFESKREAFYKQSPQVAFQQLFVELARNDGLLNDDNAQRKDDVKKAISQVADKLLTLTEDQRKEFLETKFGRKEKKQVKEVEAFASIMKTKPKDELVAELSYLIVEYDFFVDLLDIYLSSNKNTENWKEAYKKLSNYEISIQLRTFVKVNFADDIFANIISTTGELQALEKTTDLESFYLSRENGILFGFGKIIDTLRYQGFSDPQINTFLLVAYKNAAKEVDMSKILPENKVTLKNIQAKIAEAKQESKNTQQEVRTVKKIPAKEKTEYLNYDQPNDKTSKVTFSQDVKVVTKTYKNKLTEYTIPLNEHDRQTKDKYTRYTNTGEGSGVYFKDTHKDSLHEHGAMIYRGIKPKEGHTQDKEPFKSALKAETPKAQEPTISSNKPKSELHNPKMRRTPHTNKDVRFP